MTVTVRTIDIEALGLDESALVPIGGRVVDDDPCASGDYLPAELDLTGGDSREAPDRRFEA
jgi:hypothetical protein